jgi:hypothetical protein
MAARLILVKLNNSAQGNDEPQDSSEAAMAMPNSRIHETLLVTERQYQYSQWRQWHCCSLCYEVRPAPSFRPSAAQRSKDDESDTAA